MRILLFLLCLAASRPAMAAKLVIGNKAHYAVKIASTPEALQKGLMYVKKLLKNEGMLFDFRAYQNSSIAMWMKNTFIPLDMVFISCDLQITDFHENASPLSLEKITTPAPFCYVLEIPAGAVKTKGLAKGDSVTLK